jgi:hypothetical protein
MISLWEELTCTVARIPSGYCIFSFSKSVLSVNMASSKAEWDQVHFNFSIVDVIESDTEWCWLFEYDGIVIMCYVN